MDDRSALTQLEEMPSAAIDAMDAVFALCAAITEGGLSMNDLSKVIRLAVADGHEQLMLCLQMTVIALDESREVE